MCKDPKVLEVAEAIQESFHDIAHRVIWDVIMHLVNPTKEARSRIIDAVASVVADGARTRLSDHIGDLTAEDYEDATTRLDKAIKIAYQDFKEDYSGPFLTNEFLSSTSAAIIGTITNVQKEILESDSKPE